MRALDRSSSTALIAIRNQLTVKFDEPPVSATDPRVKLANEYLEKSPGAAEIFDAWDLAINVRSSFMYTSSSPKNNQAERFSFVSSRRPTILSSFLSLSPPSRPSSPSSLLYPSFTLSSPRSSLVSSLLKSSDPSPNTSLELERISSSSPSKLSPNQSRSENDGLEGFGKPSLGPEE